MPVWKLGQLQVSVLSYLAEAGSCFFCHTVYSKINDSDFPVIACLPHTVLEVLALQTWVTGSPGSDF